MKGFVTPVCALINNTHRFFLVTSCVIALTSCQTEMAVQSKSTMSDAQKYSAALADAAIATPEKVLPLRALPESGDVKVVSWVSESRLPCNGQSTCHYQSGNYVIWVTLQGEVQQKCQQWKLTQQPLRERLESLLGLPHGSPAQYQKTHFVEMTVNTKNISRPCLGVSAESGAPVCALVPSASVTDEQKLFVMQQMASVYVDKNPTGPGYPFTRLGYTYDWQLPVGQGNHYGASEFLLAANSQIRVDKMLSTDEYCAQGAQ